MNRFALLILVAVMGCTGCTWLDKNLGISGKEAAKLELKLADAEPKLEKAKTHLTKLKAKAESLPIGDENRAKVDKLIAETEKVISDTTKVVKATKEAIAKADLSDDKTFENTLKIGLALFGTVGVWIEAKRRREQKGKEAAEKGKEDAEKHLAQTVKSLDKAKDKEGNIVLAEVKMHPDTKLAVDNIRHGA